MCRCKNLKWNSQSFVFYVQLYTLGLLVDRTPIYTVWSDSTVIVYLSFSDFINIVAYIIVVDVCVKISAT